MNNGRPLVLLGIAVAALVCAAAPALGGAKVAPLTPAPSDALSRALASGHVSEARYALDRARALFRPNYVAARYGPVEELVPEAATFVLRDLAARLDELSPEDRAAAERVLARPTDGSGDFFGDGWTVAEAPMSPQCEPGGSPRYCVHWVDTTDDSPPQGGSGPDGIPDWIDETLAALDRVFARQIGDLGFLRPKNDTSSGPSGNPNGALDVYLADIGEDGLYGYCATDDPAVATRYDVSAYCVLDNDFHEAQFPFGAHGSAANKVTVAHEIHHALQFALDSAEDGWIMESTATAMEHVVYPRIRDNYQYLWSSQVARPGIPLDLSRQTSGSIYGNWIFLKYLSERVGGPKVMREIWRRLDARPGRPDRYSTQGVRRTLESKGRAFRQIFANFALANRRPRDSYNLNGLPWRLRAPVAHRYGIGRGVRKRTKAPKLDHLTSRLVVFTRRSDAPRYARLELELDLPKTAQGAAVRVVVAKTWGSRIERLTLDRSGDGSRLVPFSRNVRRIELFLVNASTRFRCWRLAFYSCQGLPRDDRRPYSFTATLR